MIQHFRYQPKKKWDGVCLHTPIFWGGESAALVRLFKVSLQAREELALVEGGHCTPVP